MKCFFHKIDLDGFCSGAIVKLKHPEVKLIGINYGDIFPFDQIEDNETVYMVDFSLQSPFDDMIKLNNMCNLIWIDHHISPIREWEELGKPNITGIRNTSKAACELVWEYLFPNNEMPLGVYLAGRYDIWDHTNPKTLPFQYGTRIQNVWPLNNEFWNKIFNNDQEFADKIIEDGKTIMKYEELNNNRIAKSMSYKINFENYRFLVCNRSHTNSKLFDSQINLPENNDVDAVMVYSRRPNCWTVSMYTSKPNIDVSKIAKRMGGGGHKGAAGFQLYNDNDAIKILMPKVNT